MSLERGIQAAGKPRSNDEFRPAPRKTGLERRFRINPPYPGVKQRNTSAALSKKTRLHLHSKANQNLWTPFQWIVHNT